MAMEEQLEILKMVEDGRISAGEASSLLAALDGPGEEVVLEAVPPAEPRLDPAAARWANFWIYPTMVGGIILILGAVVFGLIYSSRAARGWLLCGWLPMLLGLAVVLLAWWSQRATWLHLRISEEGRRKIALSFPLPLTLAAWVLRIAQPFVPQLEDSGVDDLIIALRDSASQGEPLFIDVEDDEQGERVELYIG
jgi:hypothetical protein